MLHGNIWIDNDSIPLLVGGDLHGAARVLFSDKWGDVGLNTAGADSSEQNRHNESCFAGAGREGSGNGGRSQDEESGHVDDGGAENRLVFAEVLISNDTTSKRRHVAPEGVECHQSSCALVTQTQTTVAQIATERFLDIVLEGTLHGVSKTVEETGRKKGITWQP